MKQRILLKPFLGLAILIAVFALTDSYIVNASINRQSQMSLSTINSLDIINASSSTTTKRTAVCQASSVTVRTSATSKSKALGSVKKGTKVTVLKTTGNWLQISYKSKKAYVYKSYFKVTTSSSSTKSSSSSSKVTGKDVAKYALKFVGNRYVYGGTSLTRGTDCSGFTMSVYKHFNYKIARTSRQQSVSAGKKVSLKSLKAGDLLFYRNGGSIGHVAMYIGNGKVVHASSAKTGIKVSNYNYRSPAWARRIIY